MSWIADLIKHITASNKLMTAILITSIVVVLGPAYVPALKPVPENWQWVPVSAAIFSFAMLALSFLTLLWSKAGKLPKTLSSAVRATNPQGLELGLLKHLGEKFGEDSMNLDELDYSKVNRLDVLAARDALAQKGLITVGDWSPNLIWITREGRSFLTKQARS